MTEMPALSLWQPWASLLVTRQPCDHPTMTFREDVPTQMECRGELHPMIKRFETRSWPCPPSLIGQRFAIHAAARRPDVRGCQIMEIGNYEVVEWRGVNGEQGWHLTGPSNDYTNLRFGAVVGSGVVAACLPIVEFSPDHDHQWPHICLDERPDSAALLYPGTIEAKNGDDITDQLPYGDFTPGRFAWLIEDAAPTTERCPWCWGRGVDDDDAMYPRPCRVCFGPGCREPIPAKGRQRIWHWTPEVSP